MNQNKSKSKLLEKRSAALKSNLRKRKAQSNARAAEEDALCAENAEDESVMATEKICQSDSGKIQKI